MSNKQMKAWLYKRLNHEAKLWPYYVGNRAKQRGAIRSDLETIRDALATKDAYVSLGKGDNVLHYQAGSAKPSSIKYGMCSRSGFGEYDAETYRLLGLPIIDMRPADYDKLATVVVKGPMVAVGDQPVDASWGALSFRRLAEVALGYQQAGAVLHNFHRVWN
jgi:hypothetical protein